MNLILFLETSTSVFSVSLANNTEVLFNSIQIDALEKERNIAVLLQAGLKRIDKKINDLSLIVVNAGPGGTNSVRSGVSFANSLGFSLKIPVSYYNSFEVIGRLAWQKFNTPVICTAKAINGNVYLGRYENGAITKMRYGKLETIFNDIAAELIEFTVAGMHRKILDIYSNDFKIYDSGIERSSPITLLEIKETLLERKVRYPKFVKPITENSKLFNDY